MKIEPIAIETKTNSSMFSSSKKQKYASIHNYEYNKKEGCIFNLQLRSYNIFAFDFTVCSPFYGFHLKKKVHCTIYSFDLHVKYAHTMSEREREMHAFYAYDHIQKDFHLIFLYLFFFFCNCRCYC